MDRIAGSPYVEVVFDKDGNAAADAGPALAAALATPGITDLAVLSHGWKFEGTGPRKFYDALWPSIAANLPDAGKFVVVGVNWPSKRYSTIDSQTVRQAVGGGVQAAGGGAVLDDLTAKQLDEELQQAVAALAPEPRKPEDQARADALLTAAAAYAADQSADAATALLVAIAALTGLADLARDPDLAPEGKRLLDAIGNADTTMRLYQKPPRVDGTGATGTTQGIGDVIGRIVAGPKAAVVRALEQLSFWEMKRRAGKIGQGLAGFLAGAQPPQAVKLHLVGHSFGARVVTSCAASLPAIPKVEFFSLTMLQGAFSHSSLSALRHGGFSGVPARPTGPISITHTHNDWACTFLYAIACRAANDAVQGLGDASDPFGAMGANGAQFNPGEIVAVEVDGTAFAPKKKAVNNFRADGYIQGADAHNDVTNATVGKLVAAAIRA